jgi:hypothetical protein
MRQSKPTPAGERGSAVVEFALVSIVIIPLFFGMVAIGMNMGQMIEAVQVSRDVGHMYADGVDFTQTANQNVAAMLATGTGMTATGGNAVIILSEVSQIYQADCDAGNHSSNCTNINQTVFVNRVIIGNSSLTASRFGTPAAGIVTSTGTIAANDYLTNASAVATGFAALLTAAGITLNQGDVTYVSETYFSTPSLSFLPSAAAQGVYARSIF